MGFSRIDKLFVDRNQIKKEDARARRQAFSVRLACGDDVAPSYTLQLAVLTAARIACRCFPGAVRVMLSSKLAQAPLLLWPQLELNFGYALDDILGSGARSDGEFREGTARTLIFGNAPPVKGALRVTFDGWIAKVGPVHEVARLSEREYFPVAGILAASLALSEVFLSFAEFHVEAGRRVVGVSLWRPDLGVGDAAALGELVEFLPRELWVLGLGHLGNAYLWSLATLPYEDPRAVEFLLNDFDRVEADNVETGIILSPRDEGRPKPRACSLWLEQRLFQTRLIERRFDGTFRRQAKEPGLALCGFDSNEVRRDLATAEFSRVLESGLGGTASNFDTIGFHTWPNPRPAPELWPVLTPEEEQEHAAFLASMAESNSAYQQLADDDCGRAELAGKAVTVPFVGATAACLVVAEAVRMLHGGPAFTDIKFRLGSPTKCFAQTVRNYGAADLEGLSYCGVRRWDSNPRPQPWQGCAAWIAAAGAIAASRADIVAERLLAEKLQIVVF